MTESTRAVERALDILLCLSGAEPALTLSQITERVELHKSTVYRLLATLESKRFVQREASTGAYRLGMRLVELGYAVLKHTDLSARAAPHLHRLAAEYRETVDLAILEGGQVVYLQVIESQQRVKIAAAPGERLPAFCTATGKAFLAFLSRDQVQKIFRQDARRYTARTKRSLPAFLDDLRVTRERGYAISIEEFEKGINAVAAPILDAQQRPLAAIAIVGPSFRLSRERMTELGRAVKITADTLAQEIGLTMPFSAQIT
jgi:IclR family KDG regulon transcriptional repressor